MAKENLELIMRKEWEDVRKGFYYPQLPQPRLVNNIPNAHINMKNLSIKVSEQFIEYSKKCGIQESDSLNEVLTHELTHFMKYPGSVANILRLQKAAREIVDSKKASELRTAFTEAQTNIYMVEEKKHPATPVMRRVHKPDENDSLGNLMYGLYQEVWSHDIRIKLSEKEKSLIGRLKDIDYLDKEKELDNLRRFVDVLKDYQPKEQKKKSQDGKGQRNGKESQEQQKCHDNGIGRFSNNQIKEGLRQFAQECDSPEEFEEIVNEVLSESEEEKEQTQKIFGVRPGYDKGITLLAENFYSALASRYSIPIRKKPMHKNGSLYPYTHTSFSVSDPLSELDPFSSPGIMPGITKKWVRKEGEVATDFETVPNSIIVIDNSPSMFMSFKENKPVTPNNRVYHHIVGATAISNAYLDNASKVAVYSFGSSDHFTNFSRDKEEIHKSLRRYSIEGGTTFNPRFLENVLRQSEEEFDISVISDMAISNLDKFVKTVLHIPRVHRVHLIYTNYRDEATAYVDEVRSKFQSQENVAILPLLQEQDVKKIIMGELRKSIV